MILIADSGATKTDWVLLGTSAIPERVVSTQGIHPLFQTEDDMARIVATELIPRLGTTQVDELHFYGAGCLTHVAPMVGNALCRHLTVTGAVEVCTDLLGAARALCGTRPGIACILGTGSNSCYYDGRTITANVPPLGFILGDEGSGAYLGKCLVADALKGQLPPGLKEAEGSPAGALGHDGGRGDRPRVPPAFAQPFPGQYSPLPGVESPRTKR